MSWSIEHHIGELRPWPDSVTVVRGRAEESRRYVPERICKVEMRADGWGTWTPHCGGCGADLDCDTRNSPQRFCPRCGAGLER